MRIFEDEHIYAIWIDGQSDHIVISFSNAITVPDGVRCYGDTPARKTGTACLGVVSKAADWFCPPDSIRALARSTARQLAKYQTRIAYGSSMGGYGAVKFSRLFGVTHVVALAPQWSICPEDAPGEGNLGWSSNVTPEMRGMAITADDVAGDVFLFADPRDAIDNRHAERIAKVYPATRRIAVHGSGHHVGTMLATTEFFRGVIAGALAENVASMSSIANRVRRQSGFKVEVLAARAFRRHPEWALRILAKIAEADPPQRPNVRHYFFDAFAALAERIGVERASSMAISFEPLFAGSDREAEFRTVMASGAGRLRA